jgi:undecaprenyl-phosphate 4-deoxy-4-formamido-L-arabinose transferase
MLYSVIVPVYNSQETLEQLFTRTQEVFRLMGEAFEMVFVEDCGTDHSWRVIQQLKTTYPDQIKAIKLSRNSGQHNALMCGFNHARGSFVITIDDDLQIPPEEIPHLIRKQQQTDAQLVYGVYGEKKHHLFRNLGSLAVQRVFRSVFNTSGDITSFRLISQTLCSQIISHKQNFIFIDGLLHWHTQYIARVQVKHTERAVGKSNYSPIKLIRLANNLLFNFTTFPLRSLIYLGTFFSLTSFITGIVFMIRKLFFNVPLGYTSLIVSIFFSSSVLLLVVGVIGEYIGRLYTLQNDKPQYSVKEIL